MVGLDIHNAMFIIVWHLVTMMGIVDQDIFKTELFPLNKIIEDRDWTIAAHHQKRPCSPSRDNAQKIRSCRGTSCAASVLAFRQSQVRQTVFGERKRRHECHDVPHPLNERLPSETGTEEDQGLSSAPRENSPPVSAVAI